MRHSEKSKGEFDEELSEWIEEKSDEKGKQ